MADAKARKMMTCLESLANEQKSSPRRKVDEEDEFVLLVKESIWPNLFGQYYMGVGCEEEEVAHSDENEKTQQEDDDMLFYVQFKPGEGGQEVKVYRKNSKNLPGLGDPHINWEESVYLNMLMHDLEYTLTCAICARLPNQDLKVLCKKNLNVHASHHMRRMDSKGESSDLAYPNIFFIIDSYDEVFEELSVEEGEIVCVELAARNKGSGNNIVIFLGSVKHEALLAVYDAKTSLGTKVVQKMALTWMMGSTEHFEYIRMRGPHGKGYAEMRIGLCKNDLVEHNGINRHRSLSENKDTTNTSTCNCQIDEYDQIYAQTTYSDDRCPKCGRSNSGDGATNVWTNTVKWFQQRKKPSTPTLSPHLTYVTLPWSRIMKDILQVKQKPVFFKESRK